MKLFTRLQRNSATAVFMFCLTLTAWGDTYTGTITETIVSTNDPAYFVGQVVIGSYQYDSSTIDGDFGTVIYSALNPPAQPTLQGLVFGFIPTEQAGWIPLESGTFNFLTHLVVSGQTVTNFHREGQIATADFTFEGFVFGASYFLPEQPTYYTSGTLKFSDPVSVPENSTPTALLLVVGMLGLIQRRQRLSR